MPTWTDRLIEGAQHFDLTVPEPVAAKAEVWLDLLLKWSKRIDLTTILDPDEVLEKHFLDSWVAAPRIPENATVLDAGSGAGFPGLALELLRPDLRLTSVESKTKKAVFQREVCRALDLKAEVLDRRVEDVVKDRVFHVVVARALGPLPELLDLLAPAVDPESGLLLAYKGPAADIELAALQARWTGREEPPWELETTTFELPFSKDPRRLIALRP